MLGDSDDEEDSDDSEESDASGAEFEGNVFQQQNAFGAGAGTVGYGALGKKLAARKAVKATPAGANAFFGGGFGGGGAFGAQ